MKQYLFVTMPDQSVWRVPTKIIAESRITYLVRHLGLHRHEAEAKTEALFAHDYEVEDWAANNMDWDDVKGHAVRVRPAECDFDDGWINGEKVLSDKESCHVD
ncbi:hypothetical protein [Neisseria shayeganii]|uniref:Uncharacterized protein n=1 Tax=Neisseria shayeganii TaxID=607712 RepID=A0A7D7T5D4_9NEIS|nr:hypothetical protein [Neisseria shayeganii]QMT39973.1 hypothetical protein H3L94_08945 [Neisseria shayeganii]